MTIQVMIANTSVGGRTAMVTVVDAKGESKGEHYHVEGGECRLITIWEGKQLIVSEEVPTYIKYPVLEDGKNG